MGGGSKRSARARRWKGCLGDEAGDGLEAEPGSGPDLREPQQQVGDQRGDDLDAHRILAGAEEVADLQVLLDPLEEELDLPALLVECRDLCGRRVQVVADQGDLPAAVDAHGDEPDRLVEGVLAAGCQALRQRGDTVGQDRTVPLHRAGLDQGDRRVLLQAGDEAAAAGIERGPVSEVVIALVEDVGGAGLQGEALGRGDVVDPRRGHGKADRRVCARGIDHVQLDAAVGLPALDALADHHPGRVDQAQHLPPAPARRRAQLGDQGLQDVFEQGRRTQPVGIRKGRAAHRRQPQMGVAARKAFQRTDHLAQRARPRQLGKHHRLELGPRRQAPDPIVRPVAAHQLLEAPARKCLHQSAENRILIGHGLGSTSSFDSTGLAKTKLNPSHAPCPPILNRTAMTSPRRRSTGSAAAGPSARGTRTPRVRGAAW